MHNVNVMVSKQAACAARKLDQLQLQRKHTCAEAIRCGKPYQASAGHLTVAEKLHELLFKNVIPVQIAQGGERHRPCAVPDDRIAAEKAVEANVRLRERLQQTLQELKAAAHQNLEVMHRLQKAVDGFKSIGRASRLGETHIPNTTYLGCRGSFRMSRPACVLDALESHLRPESTSCKLQAFSKTA